MVKKIFALVMVMSIVAGIVGGCTPKEEEATTPPAAGTETPAEETK